MLLAAKIQKYVFGSFVFAYGSQIYGSYAHPYVQVLCQNQVVKTVLMNKRTQDRECESGVEEARVKLKETATVVEEEKHGTGGAIWEGLQLNLDTLFGNDSKKGDWKRFMKMLNEKHLSSETGAGLLN